MGILAFLCFKCPRCKGALALEEQADKYIDVICLNCSLRIPLIIVCQLHENEVINWARKQGEEIKRFEAIKESIEEAKRKHKIYMRLWRKKYGEKNEKE